ncbi:MAG TPA: phosphate ABC transporter permease subunit PstC [Kouleothrix sp.]|uniref:phosphate ABC transporter permease subunit PstC n=1 Tax=Kouleothrix sp. TaxID=2779161 RepID=UPI002C3ADF3E|nr:phosphate ABC transporter permease subunit PstC [Kouleothrix sp.]HRC74059.1 phosphate ABC transporter permease subunit PstC [Kouleothrix sp.]
MKERGIGVLLLATALGALIALGLITYFIFQAGVPLIAKVGLWQFLSGTEWNPTAKVPKFGILPMIVGSLWLTFGSLLIGVPLGLAVAVFMVELAPPRLAVLMRPAIQLLAGIPSVIYGFIGLTLLAPLIRATLGGPGLSVLTGAIILGFMILPTIIAISEDAMRAVPLAIREGAVALGSSHWQVIIGVILPAARSGIIAGVILGMGRALGETMAVIMMIGNSLNIPVSPLQPATTLTSNIGLEMAYAGGDHRQALFGTGVVLFIFIMILNALATTFVRRPATSRRSA